MNEYYEVVHDPHQRFAAGRFLHRERVSLIVRMGARMHDGLELSDGRKRFRVYQRRFYRLSEDGHMVIWQL